MRWALWGAAVCPPPGPDQFPQEGAPVPAPADTGGGESEPPQMQLSQRWAPGPLCVLAALGEIFTPQMLKDQEQQHLPSCQRQQVLQTL